MQHLQFEQGLAENLKQMSNLATIKLNDTYFYDFEDYLQFL
jgi:hypothetical protein